MIENKIDLIHGDCLEEMKNISDKSIDFICTDLPYGTTACAWDVVIPFDKLWEQYNRIIKDNGAIALFGSEPFSSHLRMSNIKNYKYDWIWYKNKGTLFQHANKRPVNITEFIHLFCKAQPTYNPQKTKADPKLIDKRKTLNNRNCNDEFQTSMIMKRRKDDGTRFPNTVLKFEKVANGFHPTQKPVKLIEYLIKTYTNENETVLDSTMGSGTCAVACHNTKRNFVGMEMNDKYFEVAVERLRLAKEQNIMEL